MADGLTITELLDTDVVAVSGTPVAYTFPANGQAFFITTHDADITMDLGSGTTAVTLAVNRYLPLKDKNLAGKTVRFDGTGDAFIITQIGARV